MSTKYNGHTLESSSVNMDITQLSENNEVLYAKQCANEIGGTENKQVVH